MQSQLLPKEKAARKGANSFPQQNQQGLMAPARSEMHFAMFPLPPLRGVLEESLQNSVLIREGDVTGLPMPGWQSNAERIPGLAKEKGEERARAHEMNSLIWIISLQSWKQAAASCRAILLL